MKLSEQYPWALNRHKLLRAMAKSTNEESVKEIYREMGGLFADSEVVACEATEEVVVPKVAKKVAVKKVAKKVSKKNAK